MSESASVVVASSVAAERARLAAWLAAAGFEVAEARSGAEVLARLETAPVDLVVLDVRLPDLDGFEVYERIREDTRFTMLPVIHVSAYRIDADDRHHALDVGADAYLTEPIDRNELITTAQAVVRYHRARQRAEKLAERMARLAETTLALNLAPSVARLLEAAAAGAAKTFRGPVVATAETVDGECLAAVTSGTEAPATVHFRPPEIDGAPVGSTIRVDRPEDWPFVAWPAGDTVTVAVSRLRPDRPPVCIAVPTKTQLPGYPMLRQLGQAVAAALEAQRSYDEEHRIALTLQRSLLPRRLPKIAGWDIAVRYEPASAQTEVGGDFYELTAIDGGLLVAIGDVAGHSLHAATVMAELRHAVRAYAVDGHPPGGVLARVDRLVRRLLPGELATICVMRIDPASGLVRMASAGHPPPVVSAGGATKYLELNAPLLGVEAERPDDLEFTLPAGGTLVLYTDGLIERRDADIDQGLSALARSASTVEPELDRFCDRLLAELVAPGVPDDIAVIALRRS